MFIETDSTDFFYAAAISHTKSTVDLIGLCRSRDFITQLHEKNIIRR